MASLFLCRDCYRRTTRRLYYWLRRLTAFGSCEVCHGPRQELTNAPLAELPADMLDGVSQ